MIYTVGEIVLDIITRNFDDMRAKPGGAMLNTAITLGRLGLPVNHISYLSVDQNGRLILDFLSENNVGANYIYLSDQIRTNLAFAHLDSDFKAHYTFYKDDLNDYNLLKFPNLRKGDVILYGSSFSINPKVQGVLMAFLKRAKEAGALLIYDPNFRVSYRSKLNELMPTIDKAIQMAHIVKASDEDMRYMFNVEDPDEAWQIVSQKGAKVLVLTRGREGAVQFSMQGSTRVNGCAIQSVSTIGAGDTFTAGMISRLTEEDINHIVNDEPINDWLSVLKVANEFAAQVCLSYENYLSWDYIKSRK